MSKKLNPKKKSAYLGRIERLEKENGVLRRRLSNAKGTSSSIDTEVRRLREDNIVLRREAKHYKAQASYHKAQGSLLYRDSLQQCKAKEPPLKSRREIENEKKIKYRNFWIVYWIISGIVSSVLFVYSGFWDEFK